MTLETRIHREPAAADYRSVIDFRASQRLIPQAASALAVVLAELELH